MPLSAGDKLGPYEIVACIGMGGMGEVYRAVDTRLGRKVAIKISRNYFTGRFQREAAAISALNHPHICTLYDIGPDYLVMELVEGETLAARLKKGKFSFEDTLLYGAQIAAALAEAHSKGITHRDLKPANIILGKTGVKVLDFGLAKSDDDETATLTQGIMGTPAYMAPEQREGKRCDGRTDIYALGLVLFEMAAGKRPIAGTPQQLQSLPPKFAHLLERCLAPDPEEGWQSARDVGFEIEWAAADSTGAEHSALRSRLWPAIAGLSTLAMAALALIHFREAPTEQRILRSTILPPEKTFFAFANNLGPMALSPDGKRMVFAATGRDGKSQLWIRALDSARHPPKRKQPSQ